LERLDPVGCDITRADDVDGDPLAGAFLGERLREAYVARLRGGIIRLADLTFLVIDRGNTDDLAKTSLAHAFDHRAGHVEQRVLMRQRLRQAPVKSAG
jgi:hypothetical protein